MRSELVTSTAHAKQQPSQQQHAMYAADDEQDGDVFLGNTAFRVVEKQFHLHLPDTTQGPRGHRRRAKPTPQPLPDSLIDPRSPPLAPPLAAASPAAVVSIAHPGLVLFPNALDHATQLSLAQRCLEQFPNAPCTTNHTARHGLLHDLWGAAQTDAASAKLLSKLRWACVGPAYDWTARTYLHDKPHLALPVDLVNLARNHAAAAYAVLGSSVNASAVPYKPDAALVNYYRPGDTLGGHQDDVEVDQQQPIVSISLGCSAVFLMGGPTRDVAPHALLLRSGDIVVLTGPARRCFHGVPRVLDDGWGVADGDGLLVKYLQQGRINISIRATT